MAKGKARATTKAKAKPAAKKRAPTAPVAPKKRAPTAPVAPKKRAQTGPVEPVTAHVEPVTAHVEPTIVRSVPTTRAPTVPGLPATAPTRRAATVQGLPATRAPAPMIGPGPYLRSLRTCIYQVYDLALAKEFYSQALGKDPYFDEPYYVGFDVDGHELGLDPDISQRPPGGSGVIGYWRVDDINTAWQHLTTIGATSIELPHTVGVDVQVAIVSDPFGNYIGLIQTG